MAGRALGSCLPNWWSVCRRTRCRCPVGRWPTGRWPFAVGGVSRVAAGRLVVRAFRVWPRAVWSCGRFASGLTLGRRAVPGDWGPLRPFRGMVWRPMPCSEMRSRVLLLRNAEQGAVASGCGAGGCCSEVWSRGLLPRDVEQWVFASGRGAVGRCVEMGCRVPLRRDVEHGIGRPTRVPWSACRGVEEAVPNKVHGARAAVSRRPHPGGTSSACRCVGLPRCRVAAESTAPRPPGSVAELAQGLRGQPLLQLSNRRLLG